ncbi:FtsX-like permease family protein [Fructobacillus sp. M1-13]|uniref:FtsX-like permease family protein n=1 Tax=Fructobacillus papyriferae TaxID=2713171 RepID=A0ABS5QPT7_9LACO|nr:FtsX-like permease family protein [Fructobacillus papyriferae]MBS9335181.1 FtsX-like permease family protein [Fructobacillus papyriferae]MCD2159150.1 FtsX-like permease family protein [Fructobacillus papyriferae]
MFHFKLAFDSLRKNRESYLPFLLAASTAIALNFLMQLLIDAPGVKSLMMADIVRLLLVLGQVVIGLLSVVIMIYSYSFLRKGKQKEFGLYSILGLKKKDLLKISFIQQGISFVASLLIGLVSGFVFAKLMILLLIKLINGASFKLDFSIPALLFTVAIFTAIFFVLTIVDGVAVYRTKTLDLMKSEKKAANQPKNRWLLFLLGLTALVIGYGLSLTVPTPVKAIKQFFVAALLIIIATYLLFMAASTLVLKALQKKDSYYYQSKHFITVSNMLFRMKQNAVGLASITLLSTMTLVVALTTASMFFGKSSLVNNLFPRTTIVSSTQSSASNHPSFQSIQGSAKKDGISITNEYDFDTSVPFYAKFNEKGQFIPVPQSDNEGVHQGTLMKKSDYEKLTKQKANLSDHEILVYQKGGDSKDAKQLAHKSSLSDGKQRYQIKDKLSSIKNYPDGTNSVYPEIIIVTANDADYQELASTYFDSKASDLVDEHMASWTTRQILFDTDANDDQKDQFFGDLQNKNSATPYNKSIISVQDKSIVLKMSNALYGGFFFIGILFSLSFILATGLMIYYKQISEGKADRDQFDILQKVGMSKNEIKKTIRSQIVWLFGLPIVVSIAHLGFAFPMIQKLLLAFAVPMSVAVYWIMAITILLMIVIYFAIYKITSRTYFKQVTELQR